MIKKEDKTKALNIFKKLFSTGKINGLLNLEINFKSWHVPERVRNALEYELHNYDCNLLQLVGMTLYLN